MISDGLCFSVSGAEPGVAFYLIVAGNSRPGRRIGDLINQLLRLSFQLSVRGIINTASSFSRKVRELVAIVAHCPATRLWLLMFASGGKQRKTKKHREWNRAIDRFDGNNLSSVVYYFHFFDSRTSASSCHNPQSWFQAEQLCPVNLLRVTDSPVFRRSGQTYRRLWNIPRRYKNNNEC